MILTDGIYSDFSRLIGFIYRQIVIDSMISWRTIERAGFPLSNRVTRGNFCSGEQYVALTYCAGTTSRCCHATGIAISMLRDLHFVKRRILAHSRVVKFEIFSSRCAISKMKLNSRELNYAGRVILFSRNNAKNFSTVESKIRMVLKQTIDSTGNWHFGPSIRELQWIRRRSRASSCTPCTTFGWESLWKQSLAGRANSSGGWLVSLGLICLCKSPINGVSLQFPFPSAFVSRRIYTICFRRKKVWSKHYH